ncbi:hypothetical protein OROMI_019305 [Orobanche minor]
MMNFTYSVSQLDQGIWSDLRGVYNLLDKSQLRQSRPHDWNLFQELYRKCVGDVNNGPATGADLRDASFLTLSSTITYIDVEFYDLVRKLGRYKMCDEVEYIRLALGHPSFNWWSRLQNLLRGSNEAMIRKIFLHGKNPRNLLWSSPDITTILRISCQVFPEAPSSNYRMMTSSFYQPTRNLGLLPPMITYFWSGPHCLL